MPNYLGFFLGVHSLKGLLLLRALVCSMIRVRSVKVIEEFFGLSRRSATSASSSAATSAPCSGRRLLVICVLRFRLWWYHKGIKG